MSLSLSEMKALTRRFLEEGWGKGNLAVFDELCAPDYKLGTEGNLQALKDGVASIRKGFPDLQSEIGEIVAEGDYVAYRWTMHGTHLGEYEGIAPTGKSVTSSGMTFLRFANGKIVEDLYEIGSPSFETQISEHETTH